MKTVDATVKMLKEYGLSDRSVIDCFDADIIRYTKRTYPEMRTQGFPGRYMNNFTEDTYDCMFVMGIPIAWEGCTDESIKADVSFAKSRGILAWLFCADSENEVVKCVNMGCDNAGKTKEDYGITIDVPAKGFYRSESPFVNGVSSSWVKPTAGEVLIFNNRIAMNWDELEDLAALTIK